MHTLLICDVDGTLFNNLHRASEIPVTQGNTANWHQFNALHIYDKPIGYRIQLLNFAASMPGVEVIYLTGRTETFRDSTKAQLNMSRCPPGQLVMRSEHEHGTSAEFKCRALEDILCGRPDGRFWFIDDDAFVCKAVADAFEQAIIVNVPSQCCAYLAQPHMVAEGVD